MTFIIVALDGTITTPSYAPEHLESLVKYYRELKESGKILNYAIL